MQSIQKFNYEYRELNVAIDEEDAAELKEAGGDSLNELGFISIVSGLMERYGQTIDYWLDYELDTVYRLLLLNYRESKIKHNLAQIKKRKAKAKEKK